MVSQEAGLAARRPAMAASRTPKSRAVVVLLSLARYAFPSSTPRSTWMDQAPRVRADACARAAPTRSIRMLVARLLDRVIISSSSSRTEARLAGASVQRRIRVVRLVDVERRAVGEGRERGVDGERV